MAKKPQQDQEAKTNNAGRARARKTRQTQIEVARPPEVVDLFCGVGALSHGLKRAGLKIVAGYDLDVRCKHAFEKNNGGEFYARDVAKLTAAEIKRHFSGTAKTVLAGCAPCQPFSSYKKRYGEDPRWSLVEKFAQLAVEVSPDFVTMENVPALLKYKDGKIFKRFCGILKLAGYHVDWTVAKCEEFGVPQKRRRLVVIGAKSAPAPKLVPTHTKPLSVRDAIGNLPALYAGEMDPKDPLHAAAGLSPINMKRIKASKPGGTWRDWPKSLRAPCHTRESGQTYPGVYARMGWEHPAPTMTTQCYGYGNGRFGHPEQNRAISLREAAILQSFPKDYEFVVRNEPVSFTEIGRWIGNAVPVRLAEAIGCAINPSIS
jgi:DNA (cytosine-5)-methyltransferase 1